MNDILKQLDLNYKQAWQKYSNAYFNYLQSKKEQKLENYLAFTEAWHELIAAVDAQKFEI